ncbi:YoaK family protein [Ferrimonas gelatinilytica]|uniref:YoaK family protein n=1 Tax=Ferrimonas gelatinilytica TaxID=1255257 RepID=A0ABP9SGN6_9GAMM
MISKLPRWVEAGAFSLALLAGTVNAVGLLGVEHQSLSHLSGIATQLGSGLVTKAPGLWHLGGIILSFLVGSALSGWLIGQSSLRLGRHYDTLLWLEATLLMMAALLLTHGGLGGHYFASAACGLQNALVTTYSGAIVRTTHVTGVITDLGLMLGGRLRGGDFDRRKFWLLILIVAGFIGGGFLGALLFARWQFLALIGPALACSALALSYRIYRATKGQGA